jgi:catechol 2,3-dioxygenase-like lactoylglutathione lyase family enzyme
METSSLATRTVSAVISSTDLPRSQVFYEEKVGLKLSPKTVPNHLLFECAEGTSLLVYGRQAPNLAENTQARFWSNDLEADVRELRGRGVVFEEYDFPSFKTVDCVARVAGLGTSAWFKDPDGNTLALFQPE